MSCANESACVYVRCGVVCPFGCVNRHEAFETAHRARLDADGTAKPLTEIVAVMAESAIGEDHKTVHIGQATHYVARPTRTAIPRACIDAGECQRRDIIEACAKAVEACPNGLSERIEDAAARVRALGGTAKVEVGHEPDQVSDHAEGAGAERSAPAPGHAGNATPLWQDYEIGTDDVCTLDGFDGVCLMTGEVHVETGLLMSRETARSLAFRLDGLLRHIENASPMPSAAPACANCYDPATGRCIGCRQCQPGELDQADNLHLFENGNPDWVIAYDAADAKAVYCEWAGMKLEEDEDDWEQCPDDKVAKFWINKTTGKVDEPGDGVELVEMTSAEVVARHSRGFFASVDF